MLKVSRTNINKYFAVVQLLMAKNRTHLFPLSQLISEKTKKSINKCTVQDLVANNFNCPQMENIVASRFCRTQICMTLKCPLYILSEFCENIGTCQTSKWDMLNFIC